MKKIALVFFCTIQFVFGQKIPQDYFDLVKKAENYYKKKEYLNSATAYSSAFKANGWKAMPQDRFHAASSWALANYPDSAFFNLEKIVLKTNYRDYEQITSETAFHSLQNDNRWKTLLEMINQNKENSEIYKPLILQLDSIYTEDQKYRSMLHKRSYDSTETKEIWETIRKKDSINLVKVAAILDKYGWLGYYEIGEKANTTLFLVIQHSDLQIQEKYLPMLRKAVKNGKTAAGNLAYLEDRIALRQGKKQIYGSQYNCDEKTGKCYFSPIEDEPNVNKRRAEVGLGTIEEYAKFCKVTYTTPAK